jgi:serine/threonine protein phosphatase PrpC
MPLTSASSAASFRRDTEDRYALHVLDDGLVVVVADGAGGIPGGGAAADRVLGLAADAIAAEGVEPYDASSWVELLRRADSVVEADPFGGETTAVVVAVRVDGFVVGAGG